MDSYFIGIDNRVRMASRKADVKKKVVYFGIPRSMSLLKTIKRFIKETNKARVIMYISRRLFHVYFFLQIPMQEGEFNIHLIELPFM
jgi:adenylate kinase family enzyme